MKGLLIKELLILKRNLRTLCVILLAYGAFGIVTDNAFMSGVVAMMLNILTINSFGYDQAAKWDGYALSLPVSRRQMVLSKYLLALMMALAGAVFVLLLGITYQIVHGQVHIIEQLAIAGALLATGLLLNAVLIPLIYQFGIEKARVMLVAIFVVPTIVVILLKKLNLPLPALATLKPLLWVLPVVFVAILVGSVLLSCRIFSRKEL